MCRVTCGAGAASSVRLGVLLLLLGKCLSPLKVDLLHAFADKSVRATRAHISDAN